MIADFGVADKFVDSKGAHRMEVPQPPHFNSREASLCLQALAGALRFALQALFSL